MASLLSSPAARVALVGGMVDLATRVVRVGGRADHLTQREAELLQFLVDRAGETVPRDVLMREVFGYQPSLPSRAVDTTISRLRAKLELHPDRPSHLISAYGEGYRWQPLPRAPMERERVGLPIERTPLLGRASDVATTGTALRAHRRVQLVGPGGVGKSRVAARAAAEAEDERVLFVGAAHATTAADVVSLVERALGVPADGARTAAAASERVGRYLDERPSTLLVVDCVEQIAGVEALLEAWLAQAASLRILTTSRREGGGALVRVDCLDPEAATALYVERAAAAGGPVAPADLDAVRTLVASLDHLPLAIELAAAKARSLSPSQITLRLGSRLRLLSGGPRDAEPRAASLRAALDWSWDLLGDPDRDALARLSVSPGAIERDAAAAVVGADAVERLGGLVAASLVQTADDGWVLLESVRAWALEKADLRGVRAEAELAHATFYAAWLDTRVPAGATLDSDVANAVDAELTHLLAIPARAELARPALAVQVVRRLWELFQLRGVLDPYLTACDCAVRAARSTDHHELPNVLHARATTLRLCGRRVEAERDLDDAVAVAVDPATRAWLWCESALVQADLGRLDVADARMREHLPQVAPGFATSSRAAWAVIRTLRGDRGPDVLALYRRSLAEAEARGALRLVAGIRSNLAVLLVDLERYDEAEPLLIHAIAELRQLGATRRLPSPLSGLASIRVLQGRFDEAERLSREIETIARVTGNDRWLILALANQAGLDLRAGELEEGLRRTEEAEAVAGAADPYELHLVDLYRAALLAAADRTTEAHAAARQARERIDRAGGDHSDLVRAVEAHVAWAEARAAAERGEDASAHQAAVQEVRSASLTGTGARFLAALLPAPEATAR